MASKRVLSAHFMALFSSWAWVSNPRGRRDRGLLAATLQQRFKIKFEKQKERVRRRCSPPGVKLLETQMPSPADREALVASFMTRQDQDKVVARLEGQSMREDADQLNFAQGKLEQQLSAREKGHVSKEHAA